MVSPVFFQNSYRVLSNEGSLLRRINPLDRLKSSSVEIALKSLSTHSIVSNNLSTDSRNFFLKAKQFISDLCNKVRRIWNAFARSFVQQLEEKKDLFCAKLKNFKERFISNSDLVNESVRSTASNDHSFPAITLNESFLSSSNSINPSITVPPISSLPTTSRQNSSTQTLEEEFQVISVAFARPESPPSTTAVPLSSSFSPLSPASSVSNLLWPKIEIPQVSSDQIKNLSSLNSSDVKHFIDEAVFCSIVGSLLKPYLSNTTLLASMAVLIIAMSTSPKRSYFQYIADSLSSSKNTPEAKEMPTIAEPVSPIRKTESKESISSLELSSSSDHPVTLTKRLSNSSAYNSAVRTHHLVGKLTTSDFWSLWLSSWVDGTVTLEGTFPDDVEPTDYQNVYLVKYRGEEKFDYKKKKFAYLNGSGNSFDEAMANARIIASIVQNDILLGYLPTVHVFQDLYQALWERYGFQAPEKHADICKNLCLKASEDDHEVILMPHSRGFHATKEFSKRHLTSSISSVFEKIRIKAIAGSSDMHDNHGYKEVSNTVCLSDYLIRCFDNDSIARQRAKGSLREVELQGSNKSIFFSGHTFVSPTTKSTIEHYIKEVRQEVLTQSTDEVLAMQGNGGA